MKKKSRVSVIMGLTPCWDVQVFPRQEETGPQRLLQTWGTGTSPSHGLWGAGGEEKQILSYFVKSV